MGDVGDGEDMGFIMGWLKVDVGDVDGTLLRMLDLSTLGITGVL